MQSSTSAATLGPSLTHFWTPEAEVADDTLDEALRYIWTILYVPGDATADAKCAIARWPVGLSARNASNADVVMTVTMGLAEVARQFLLTWNRFIIMLKRGSLLKNKDKSQKSWTARAAASAQAFEYIAFHHALFQALLHPTRESDPSPLVAYAAYNICEQPFSLPYAYRNPKVRNQWFKWAPEIQREGMFQFGTIARMSEFKRDTDIDFYRFGIYTDWGAWAEGNKNRSIYLGKGTQCTPWLRNFPEGILQSLHMGCVKRDLPFEKFVLDIHMEIVSTPTPACIVFINLPSKSLSRASEQEPNQLAPGEGHRSPSPASQSGTDDAKDLRNLSPEAAGSHHELPSAWVDGLWSWADEMVADELPNSTNPDRPTMEVDEEGTQNEEAQGDHREPPVPPQDSQSEVAKHTSSATSSLQRMGGKFSYRGCTGLWQPNVRFSLFSLFLLKLYTPYFSI